MADLTKALWDIMGGGGPDAVSPVEAAPTPAPARGKAPADVGQGLYVPVPSSGGSGGGVASPLTESSYAARTWWTEKVMYSTDGLMFAKVRPLKSIAMTDANGASVVFNFANPT